MMGAVGVAVMLGTLFGLVVVIFAAVYWFDPEARPDRDAEPDR